MSTSLVRSHQARWGCHKRLVEARCFSINASWNRDRPGQNVFAEGFRLGQKLASAMHVVAVHEGQSQAIQLYRLRRTYCP